MLSVPGGIKFEQISVKIFWVKFIANNCIFAHVYQVRGYLEENLKVNHQFPMEKIHHLLIALRLQTQRCGDYLATQQLLSILMTMYTTGASFFIFVTVLANESVGEGTHKRIVLTFASIWPLYGMSRLYAKVSMAVRITKEVCAYIVMGISKFQFGTNLSCIVDAL